MLPEPRLLLGCVLLAACQSEKRPTVDSSTAANLDWLVEQTNPRDSLVLVAMALSDTVARDGPIRLAYFIRNDGDPSLLRHDSDWIGFDVIAPSGAITPMVGPTANIFAGPLPEITLPHGGILGQRVDLTCVKYLYSSARARCYYRFVFREAGEYKVVVRYSPPQLAPEATGQPTQRSGPKWLPLSSDTVRFIVR